VTRSIYYTATTLDGFIADEHDSLAWLFEQDIDEAGPGSYQQFIPGIWAMIMGTTTYRWIGDHMAANDEAWAYEIPCWVFTHQELDALGEDIRFVQGAVIDRWEEIRTSAGERDVWVVGGGDLAGQFADAGLLDQVMLSIAPVTLGTGRPLFPRRHDLELVEIDRNGAFAVATYDVRGPREA